MMTAILSISVVAIIALYFLFYVYHKIYSVNYWKKKGVHALKPNLLFGNLTGVIFRKTPAYRMFQEVYSVCKKRGDKFMGFYFLNKPALVIADPELVKNILAKDFSNFTDRPFYCNEEDPFTVNIASAKGNQWKKMREQLSPAFSPSKLKNVCHTLLKVGEQLKAVLDRSVENYEVVDLKDVTGKYIVDAIGMSVFGIECNTLQNSNMEFMSNAENILGGSFIQNVKLLSSMFCPSILQFFKIPFIRHDVQNFFLNLIKTTVEHRENNNIVRNDLMQSMIQLKNNVNMQKENGFISSNDLESEKSFKIEEIAANAVIFFGAAYESTAATISLCVYELAANEDIQNNLRNEIARVLGEHEGEISYDAIMKMTYLDKCISETLRKYAVVGMIARVCTEDYKLPNCDVVLDVGSTLYIPIYEIQSDPQYYPNPEKFDPERFSPENKLNRPSYTFLSLGEGQRNCIGSRLGQLKIKIFLITLLTNYNFSINSRSPVPPPLDKSNVMVCFKNPLYLNVAKI